LADALAELNETLSSAQIELSFAELKDPVKDKLKRFGLFSIIGERCFFPTIENAVRNYVQVHAIDWVDQSSDARQM
jgi:STAS domain